MRKTTITAIAALSVAGAIAIGLGAVSSWYTNWNVKTWFGREDNSGAQSDISDKPSAPNTGNLELLETEQYDDMLVSTDTAQAFQFFTARSASSSDTSFALIATVTDEDGETPGFIQDVTWSMSWNGTDFAWTADTWAEEDNSPSDFITMTTDGGTATFTLNYAFGTQIKVTCTSNINSNVSATVTIDYCKRLKSFKAKWGSSATEQTIFNIPDDDLFNVVPDWFVAQQSGDYPTMPGQVQLSRIAATPGVTGLQPVSGWEYGIGSIADPIFNANSYVEISLQPVSGYSGTYTKAYADLQGYIYSDTGIYEMGLMSSILGSNRNNFYNDGTVYELNNRDKDLLVHFHFVTQNNKVYDICYYVDVVVPQPNVTSIEINPPTVLL